MKRILYILLLTIPIIGLSQKFNTQNIFLKQKNGFRDIKLGDDIRSLSFVKNHSESSVKVTIKTTERYKSLSQEYYDFKYIVSKNYDYNLVDEIKLWVVDENNSKYKTIGNNININKTIVFTYKYIIYKIIIIVDNPYSSLELYNQIKIVFGEETYTDICPDSANKYEKDPRKNMCHINWRHENIQLYMMSFKDGNNRHPVKLFWEIEYKDTNIIEELVEKQQKLEKIKDKQYNKKVSEGF